MVTKFKLRTLLNVVGGSSGHTMLTTSSSQSKFNVSWDVKPRWKGKGKKFNILGGKEAMKTDEKYTQLLAFKPRTRKK